MSDSEQIVKGLFPDTPAGRALAKYKFARHMTLTANILETISGVNGLKINKPGNDGECWTIGPDYSDDAVIYAPPIKSWDINFTVSGTTWTANLLHCVDWRAGVTSDIGDVTHTMGAGDEYYISCKYHTKSGVNVLVSDTTIAAVTAATTPAYNEVYSYRLLYYVVRVKDSDGDTIGWRKVVDYRTQIERGQYG